MASSIGLPHKLPIPNTPIVYTLVKELGRGSFGVVYKARNDEGRMIVRGGGHDLGAGTVQGDWGGSEGTPVKNNKRGGGEGGGSKTGRGGGGTKRVRHRRAQAKREQRRHLHE